MGSIIIALSKSEDARRIGDILKRHGLETTVICTTASSVISHMSQLDGGVVISGCHFPDMYYAQLAEYMPEYFEMLLLASPATLENTPPIGIEALRIPFRAGDLVNKVESMLVALDRRLKKPKKAPKKRSEQEQAYINEAKRLLMERNNMTEQEAFRYIQKCSMDSGSNMVETAQKVLVMLDLDGKAK